MNPFGSVTDSIPGVGGGGDSEDSGVSKEEAEEQERLRQEAIRQAEKERRDKYKKQEEEREGMRQTIRDKYNIEKKKTVTLTKRMMKMMTLAEDLQKNRSTMTLLLRPKLRPRQE